MRTICILLVYSTSESTHLYSITGNFLIRQVYNQAIQVGHVQPGQRSRPGRPAGLLRPLNPVAWRIFGETVFDKGQATKGKKRRAS
jgi:hypothetical protein